MSVLIKGIGMPKRCVDCKLKRDKHLPTACIFRDWQSLTVNDTPQTNEWCPLLEVPPHGRLIDADVLEKKFCSHCDDYMSGAECEKENCFDLKIFKSMPTIIPADKDGET